MIKPLSTLTALIESNTIVMTDIDYWVMHCWNMDSKEILWSCDLFQDEPGKLFFNEQILHIKGRYYFTYRNVLRIKEFNPETNVVNNYDLGGKLGKNNDFICRVSFEFEEDIIILPGDILGSIWKFNTSTHCFCDLGNVYRGKISYGLSSEDRLIVDYCLMNDKYWYINRVNNTLCYVDQKSMDVGEISVVAFGNLRGILSPKKSNEIQSIYAYDSLNNLYSYNGVKFEPINIDYQLSDISSMFKYKNKLIVIPKMDRHILIWERDDSVPRIIPMPSEYRPLFEVRRFYGGPARAIVANGKCYLPPFSANGMLIIDLIEETVSFIRLEENEYDINMIKDTPVLLFEESQMNLKDFLMKTDKNNESRIIRTYFGNNEVTEI